jgi:selenocysteine-specific elongation factor
VDDLPIRLGLRPEEVQAIVAALEARDATVVAGRLYPAAAVSRARKAALESVERFQADNPLQQGMPMESFRRQVGSPAMADHVRQLLESEGALEVAGGAVRLPGFSPTLAGPRAEYGVVVENKLAAAGAHGGTLADLADDLPADMAAELAEFFVRRGTAVRVGQDRYYDRATLTEMSRRAVAEIERLGEVKPADLRDALGLSRKYLIPLLEWLDARQVTVRVGDTRRLGPNAHQE